MECLTVKSKLSAYLDGAVSEEERLKLRLHLHSCRICSRDAEKFQRLRDALRALPPRVPPPELAVRLRVVASHERDRVHGAAPAFRAWRTSANLFLKNLMRPIAVPLVGGICSAIFLFGTLVPSFTWHKTPGDVPTVLSTEPAVKTISPLGFMDDANAVVDLRIDEEGRIVNYAITGAEGQKAEQLRRSIENNLLFTTFTPATAFGKPIAGTIRISFRSSRIEVRG
jgi:hypothetical protein